MEFRRVLFRSLTLTLGGRLFEYRSRPRLQYLPNANLVDPFDFAPAADKDSDFIPKASLTYKPSDDFMVYALYSGGFRIGGVRSATRRGGTGCGGTGSSRGSA